MRKNVAGQTVAFQMVSAADGSDITSGTPAVYYTIEGGTQGTGAGTSTHEGNGQWSYVPTQAETNGNHVAFTMVLSGAISQTVNVYPVSYNPTDAVRLGLTALPNAAADAAGGLPISDAGGLDLDTQLGKLVGTLATGTHSPQSGDAFGYLGTNLGALGANATEAGGTGDQFTGIPSVGAVTGGINTSAGTITTLDGLDTAQDEQHATTQAAVSNLSVGSGGISTTNSGFTATTAGTETNDETATYQLDGVLHIVPQTGGNTDAYYEFSVGRDGVPIGVEWHGYAQANGDSYAVYFYNWSSTSWEQVGTIAGGNGSTVGSPLTFSATVAHVGTGANAGLVRWRFASSDGTNFATDRILCTYTVLAAGITNGSTITLTDDTLNQNLVGNGWVLATGGQDIGGSYFYGAKSVTGTFTGTLPVFDRCAFGNVTGSAAIVAYCVFGGTWTANGTGDYRFFNCDSNVPGASAPAFDFSGQGGATTFQIRKWSGGITITADSDVTGSLELHAGGTVTVTTGGADIEIRGTCRALNITMSGNETVQFVGATGHVTLSGATSGGASTFNAYGVISDITNNCTGDGCTVDDDAVSAADLQAVLADTNDLQTNQGDWATATGFSTLDAAGIRTAVGLASANLDTQLAATKTVVDAVLVDTAEIGAAGAGLSGIPWNASWDAEVQSECTDALNAYDPPTRAELTADIDSVLAKSLAYTQLIVRSDAAIATDNATELTAINADGGSGAGGFSNQTDSVQGIRDRGDSAWTTGAGGSAPSAADIRAEIDSNSTQLAAIVLDTGTTLPGLLATAQADLDTITGSDGVTLATTQGNYAPAVAGNQMDLVNAPNATAVTAIQSGLATASALSIVGGNVTAVKAVTDALTAAAAAKLATSAGTIVTGTVSTATTSPTTTVFAADDITEATADHFNGRIVIFTSGVLANQATDITDYELDTGEGKFTVTALTESPANNDTFVIV